MPRLAWRRSLTHRLARIALALLGLRVTATGLENLPEGSCVVVANHSSYLDGVVLTAILPPRFSFVIKREAADMPFVGFLLLSASARSSWTVTDHGGRQRGARRVIQRAEQGHSLVFFPEGTFDETVGLKRFHVGAFIAAVRGGMPVVPRSSTAREARHAGHALSSAAGRDRGRVPRPAARGRGGRPMHFATTARRLILERLDEPDLAPTHDAAGPADLRIRANER